MPLPLNDTQQLLLTRWLGNFDLVHDHSWPLQDTAVLQVHASGTDFIVKASTASHHIRREIDAHRRGLPAMDGRVPVLKNADPAAGILVTKMLPGTLVEGAPSEFEPETYRQAGVLLNQLQRPVETSPDHMAALVVKTKSWMDRAPGLVPDPQLAQFEARLAAVQPRPVELVATHGDYHPRNWLHDDGVIKVIDFGRAGPRPWVHDLIRLSHQQLLEAPKLAQAFHDGLGRIVTDDDADIWLLENLNQAIGTVVWAHQVGDELFEQAGRRMMDRVLAGFPPFCTM